MTYRLPWIHRIIGIAIGAVIAHGIVHWVQTHPRAPEMPTTGTVGMPTPLYTSTGTIVGSTYRPLEYTINPKGATIVLPQGEPGTIFATINPNVLKVLQHQATVNQEMLTSLKVALAQIQLLNGRMLQLERRLPKEPTQ